MTGVASPAHYSHSQLSHPCGLQIKYHRERVQSGRVNIASVYGRALHKGLEAWALARIDGRSVAAEATLADEIDYATDAAIHELGCAFLDAEKKQTPVVMDPEPRMKKDGEPYAGQGGNIQTRERAEAMLKMHVREYLKRFAGSVVPQSAERQIDVTMKRPAGRVIRTVIDRIDEDTTIVDYKTARNPWDRARLESKKAQAYLYQVAFVQTFGVPPKAFEFHVFTRQSPVIEVFSVPFDPEAINQYMELFVRPQIAAIEAGIFIPNTEGWHCSRKFCDYWYHCPLGEASRPEEVEA